MVTEGAEFLALTHSNHPNGSTISSEELQAAVEIRQSAGVRVVSDETYGLMTEGEPLPPAACADPTAVSLSTMSKTFGLPGIRIGWITTREADLMHRLLAAVSTSPSPTTCPASASRYRSSATRSCSSPALGLASPRTAPSSPT
jgi:aspartate/methionine/tyrosine aminotransferase